MRKYVNAVCVYTTEDGQIAIEAPGWCSEIQQVLITPEQADAVAQWILAAKAELQAAKQE